MKIYNFIILCLLGLSACSTVPKASLDPKTADRCELLRRDLLLMVSLAVEGENFSFYTGLTSEGMTEEGLKIIYSLQHSPAVEQLWNDKFKDKLNLLFISALANANCLEVLENGDNPKDPSPPEHKSYDPQERK